MRDLRLRLDDLRFDELAEIGRSLVPSLVPQWTDHNIHDPGIMLMELMAWIADAQIYAIARGRRDERHAYARLMGVQPSGPAPASGLVWPEVTMMTDPGVPIPWARGTVVAPTRRLQASSGDAPVFHPTNAIYLTTCRLSAVTAIADDGTSHDLTAVNRHGGTSFLPFGAAPGRRAQMCLAFAGGSVASSPPTERTGLLSIGVEVEHDAAATDDPPFERTPIRVTFRGRDDDADSEKILDIALDSTAMFTRSGVFLLKIDPVAMGVDDGFSLTFDCPSGAWLVVPRVRRVLPNVLPVLQREPVDLEDTGVAQGVPDESMKLLRAGMQFGPLVEPVAVSVLENGKRAGWKVVDDFARSGPSDPHVVIDTEASSLHFGNGVNGKLLEQGAQVQASYVVSAGDRGNLVPGLRWTVQGIVGTFGTNAAATRGGRAAQRDADVQALARQKLRDARPIVSSQDLEDAARLFADLGVARAQEFLSPSRSGWGVPGHRTLVVMGTHVDSDDAAVQTFESKAWRAKVETRLAARLPLGQRLRVVEPRYVVVDVRARLLAKPRVASADLAERARKELRRRFALVAAGGAAAWPFGRSVSKTAVSGWLRKVEGVAQVLELGLMADGVPVEAAALRLPPTGLPLYRPVSDSVRVLGNGE